MEGIKLPTFKFIQFSKKLLTSSFLFLLWGCPPKKSAVYCAVEYKNPVKQSYVTGIESGRGKIYQVSVLFDCKDSLTIDSVRLGEKKENFRVLRGNKRISTLFPNDSIQVVVTTFQRDEDFSSSEGEKHLTIYYSTKELQQSFQVNEVEFKMGEPIQTR